MSTATESSDSRMLDVLRRRGALTIGQLIEALEVTATAVRQRLSRLMAQGLVEREIHRAGRGRPGHRYRLSERAQRMASSNFADLSIVLWEELRAIPDAEVRRGLLTRLASRLAERYSSQVTGGPVSERMRSLGALFADRGIPLETQEQGGLPVLRVLDCPYPELAEKDRGICALEKMLFEELLKENVKLSQCRLDGHPCCEFATV